jgi:hypothetical protein
MKFYLNKNSFSYWDKIISNKLTAIYTNRNIIQFYKNGKEHNDKNFSFINYFNYKYFCLNGESYGTEKDFTKQLWRRFVKLKAFL